RRPGHAALHRGGLRLGDPAHQGSRRQVRGRKDRFGSRGRLCAVGAGEERRNAPEGAGRAVERAPMQTSRIAGLGVVFLLVACHGSSDTPKESSLMSSPVALRLQEAISSAAGLQSPMDLQAPPGDPRLFIAERPGRIRIVDSQGALLATPFLDISSRVYTDGEAGLLSFTFDPHYAVNGFVYVHFIENIVGTTGDIVVDRYQLSANPNVLQSSGVEVIRI